MFIWQENQLEIAEAGVIRSICNAMKTHSGVHGVQQYACSALWALNMNNTGMITDS